MKFWPFKRKAQPSEPEPLPEDQPLWVLVDTLLSGRLPRDERAYIRVCVENWELRRENKDLRLQDLHRQAAANLAAVLPGPMPKPHPIRQHVTRKRNHATKVRATTKPKRQRAEYYRKYRARTKLHLVTSNPSKDAS